MTTGPAVATLDWRAIAAGAGASIAIGMSASFLMLEGKTLPAVTALEARAA